MRRHVYLLVNNFNRATYPLRRIDVSTLFSSTDTASSTKLSEAPLPQPFISFAPPRGTCFYGKLDFFSRFGQGKNKSFIAGADQNGGTFLYDLDQRTVHSQVRLNQPKMVNTISVAARDALYVLDNEPHPGGCFEALRCQPSRELVLVPKWRWHSLPPPPYVLEPGYTPTSIGAYTTVNSDCFIWISTPGLGTYSFNTLLSELRKEGDWELPFRGRADFFPEYNLWLGFSSKHNMLCSSTLDKPDGQGGRPVLLNTDWDEDLQAHESWIPGKSFLVKLGFGKFCVPKFFQTHHKERTAYEGDVIGDIQNFVLLTGLTLLRTGVNGELRMIRHGSQLYYFQTMTNGWVF
ncbi:hypothetical protein HU200_001507 [Digitaria exilis]|uniref:Uncharacterized protein n=1 Tax=Digitaria exilis TaxID=1010633 RepID=A0A835FYJ9_9POAL|nr:hypothetical protein HU200_001507 [Digitaria exilis]